MKLALLLSSLLLAACAPQLLSPGPPPALSWREAATSNDRERLREWRGSFDDALATARRAGHAADIAREGALLNPDAALGGPPIPNGEYRCRVVKVGAKADGLLDFVAYPNFRCRVSPLGAVQRFAKLSGSQRYFGRLYPSDAMRQIFLGTLALGDETHAMKYGTDRERDVAGYVERIGPARWRLVLPRPHFESRLDVLELVPAS